MTAHFLCQNNERIAKKVTVTPSEPDSFRRTRALNAVKHSAGASINFRWASVCPSRRSQRCCATRHAEAHPFPRDVETYGSGPVVTAVSTFPSFVGLSGHMQSVEEQQ
ncbi:unnamed protein product [Toxocara canis]|uniref:Uncharacterized protein n=1 Tax=Toxocara canis TaxID=6265 RepID=A0A183ULQ9_TOXCA|nr:unnamed protein product [Toxocara canis]